MKTTPLYSMRRLETELGVNRSKLMGLVLGLGLKVYEGPRGSFALDARGLARLRAVLGREAAAAAS